MRKESNLCHHCDKHVCRRHFKEHVDKLMQQLDSLADSFNELGEEIKRYKMLMMCLN